MMRGSALFAVLVAGCSALEYPRVSGETYYAWLASSFSPVLEFPEHRLEGDGICISSNGGKGQDQGFVTAADITSAAKRDPDVRLKAKAYQQAFAEGMLRGMTDSFNVSVRTGVRIPQLVPDVPADFTKHAFLWRDGWERGYRYGVLIGQNIE